MNKSTARRLLILMSAWLLFAGLACLSQAQPQFGFPPGTFQSRAPLDAGAGFTPSCTESGNFLARATDLTITADKTNYDTLICGLVTDTVFADLDALYIWATTSAGTRSVAKLNLIQNTFNLTENGTVAFTAYQGYTGDVSTFYLDTGFTPSTASGQFALNSASIGFYILTNKTAGSNQVCCGGNSNAADVTQMNVKNFGGDISIFINAAIGTAVTFSNSTWQGQYVITRTSSTNVDTYKNGSTSGYGSATQASVSLTAVSLLFFGVNSSGTPSPSTDVQMSAAFLGKTLNSTKANALAGRINTYMTAYGINVY